MASVGGMLYAAIITASSTSAEPNAIVSVMTPASGIMPRSNRVLSTIEWRS